jgi:hypothetical protein
MKMMMPDVKGVWKKKRVVCEQAPPSNLLAAGFINEGTLQSLMKRIERPKISDAPMGKRLQAVLKANGPQHELIGRSKLQPIPKVKVPKEERAWPLTRRTLRTRKQKVIGEGGGAGEKVSARQNGSGKTGKKILSSKGRSKISGKK